MSSTWLRIVTYTVDTPDAATADLVEYVQDGVRLLDGRAGFRGGEWGRDAESCAFAAITNWASREAIEAAAGDLEKLHETRREQGLRVAMTANLHLVTTPLIWSPEDWAAVTNRTASNWMRVAFYSASGTGADSPAYLRDSSAATADMLRGQDGFRVAYWGHDPGSGVMGAITYWSSREAIEAAQPALDRLHAQRTSEGAAIGSALNLELLHVELPSASGPVGWS